MEALARGDLGRGLARVARVDDGGVVEDDCSSVVWRVGRGTEKRREESMTMSEVLTLMQLIALGVHAKPGEWRPLKGGCRKPPMGSQLM